MRPNRNVWITVCVLLAVTLAVFWNVPRGEFVRWDDDIKIYRNEHLGPFSWEGIRWMFTDTERLLYYAPVSWLMLSCIWQVWKLDPFGYHLASLLLHLANTVLVYLILRAILRLRRVESFDGSRVQSVVLPGVAGLLWAIHPLRVEAVAWATPVSHLLASFFALLAVFFFLRFRNRSETQHVSYFISLAAFSLAMLSYPVVLAFPAAIAALDYYFWVLRPPPFDFKALRRRMLDWIPYILIALAGVSVTLYGRAHAVRFWSNPVSIEHFRLSQRVMQAFYVWGYYLWKPLVPLRLSPMDLNLSEIDPVAPKFIFSGLFICGLTVFLVVKWRRFPGLLALWICYLALLVPMLGLTEFPHYTSDRYSYLPAILQSIFLAVAIQTLWTRLPLRSIALVVLTGLIGLSALLSYRQTAIWHDSRSLFTHVISLVGPTPAAGVMHTRLGLVLADAGELERARREFEEALRLYPGYDQAYAGLGHVLALQGRLAEALTAYDSAVRAGPYDAQTQFERAALLSQQDRAPEAITGYRTGLHLDPGNAEALNNLAWILATSPESTNRFGTEAVDLALRACELTRFQRPTIVGTLAAAYAEAGKFDLAIRTAERARSLALARGDSAVAARNEELLALYKAGKAYRAQ